jgi:hypothetical protein
MRANTAPCANQILRNFGYKLGVIEVFFMSYLPELNRAFGRGFFGKWFKILIDDQIIICFSLAIVGKPDREKNKGRGFWQQILCFNFFRLRSQRLAGTSE